MGSKGHKQLTGLWQHMGRAGGARMDQLWFRDSLTGVVLTALSSPQPCSATPIQGSLTGVRWG